jgi:hypothetical protein
MTKATTNTSSKKKLETRERGGVLVLI